MRMQRLDSKYGGGCNVLLAVVLSASSAVLGCSSSGTLGVGDKAVATTRSRTVDHEPCDLESKSTEKVDANGDGRPDLSIVKNGSKEVCRAADLDFDGKIDMWTYLDAAGNLRRRELDYDRDGNVDEIQLFKSGEIAEKQRASTPAKRLDTWEFYSGGRLVRAERDSDANGRVDQWWDYKTPDCPVIRADTDGNGEPDAKSEVDYCKESGYKPPEPTVPTAAPMLQKETEALPTETSNRLESAESAPEKSGAAKKAESVTGSSGDANLKGKRPEGPAGKTGQPSPAEKGNSK